VGLALMEIKITTADGDPYEPLPTQKRFHASTAKHKAFVGAFGQGKTQVGAIECLLQALEYPGKDGEAVVARHDYKGLMGTTWKTLKGTIPREVIADVIDSPPKGPLILLKNGFALKGWNLKAGGNMSSLNLAFFWIDECNEPGVEERHYQQLRGRLRDKRGSQTSWLTGNPEGKNWVYEKFFAADLEPGKKRWANHEGFLAAREENHHLPPDYYAGLREYYDDIWIEKYLNGSFDVFEGQVFDNFNREIHVVSPFGLPDTWPRFRGLDHGLVNPTACLWAGSDFSGNILCYRLYYKRNSIPDENAANILRLSEGELIEWTEIDPSTHQTQSAGGTSERIIDQYRKAGLVCNPGNNAVKDSIALIRHMLQPDPNRPFPDWHPLAKELGSPRLFFTSDCAELLFEIQNYQWKQVKPGGSEREQPRATNDHAIAALRYLLMRSPRPAVEIVQQDQYHRFLAIANELKGERLDADGFDYANIIGNEGVSRRRSYSRSH
jgi:phage terminase large subunit